MQPFDAARRAIKSSKVIHGHLAPLGRAFGTPEFGHLAPLMCGHLEPPKTDS